MIKDPPKRRFFRYSLRTLFVVVTVFCVWMGITAKRARDQKQAVEAILEMGGFVFYEHQGVPTGQALPWTRFTYSLDGPTPVDPPGPAWLRKLIGDEYFFRVFWIQLNRSQFRDVSLAAISRLADVKRLALNNNKISDAGLVHLKGLTHLDMLALSDNNVTDDGLVYLKGLTNLRYLYLNRIEITDAGLKHLNGMTKLQLLSLHGTHVTEEGIERLQQTLPNCTIGYTDTNGSAILLRQTTSSQTTQQ